MSGHVVDVAGSTKAEIQTGGWAETRKSGRRRVEPPRICPGRWFKNFVPLFKTKEFSFNQRVYKETIGMEADRLKIQRKFQTSAVLQSNLSRLDFNMSRSSQKRDIYARCNIT